MYNHGLATFVLGQAHGMTGDARINSVLDKALKLIANTQCQDGGWDYRAKPQERGHDLSLAVMQAKARSAVDSGLEVPPEVIDLAIKSVREHYQPADNRRDASESEQQRVAGQFTYSKGGGQATIAMAAAGVVCLQEFGQYDDWRIPKNMEIIARPSASKNRRAITARSPSTATRCTTSVRRCIRWAVKTGSNSIPTARSSGGRQVLAPNDPVKDGMWASGAASGRPPLGVVRHGRRLLRIVDAQPLSTHSARRQDRQSAHNFQGKK